MRWLDVLIVLFLVAGVIGFVQLVRFRTRFFDRRTDRRGEDLYPAFGRERRRLRRRHIDDDNPG